MPAYTKRIIRQACLKVLDNPKSTPKETLQAAAILEKLCRVKDLARLKKKKIAADKKGHMSTFRPFDDILCHTSAEN